MLARDPFSPPPRRLLPPKALPLTRLFSSLAISYKTNNFKSFILTTYKKQGGRGSSKKSNAEPQPSIRFAQEAAAMVFGASPQQRNQGNDRDNLKSRQGPLVAEVFAQRIFDRIGGAANRMPS